MVFGGTKGIGWVLANMEGKVFIVNLLEFMKTRMRWKFEGAA